MVLLLAERSDTKSNVKFGGFRSQVQASYVSRHTDKWMTIYIYIYIKFTKRPNLFKLKTKLN